MHVGKFAALILIGLTSAFGAPAVPVLSDSDCLDCHGIDSLAKTNADGRVISLFVDADKLAASVHKTNSCVSCHTDVTAQHPDDQKILQPVNCAICHPQQTASYGASVHGLAVKAGDQTAATCQDCHDSHDILPPDSPVSQLYFSKQAQTCGQCHVQEAADWAKSVHGKAAMAGNRDAPTCTDCHSEHKIQALKGSSAQTISDVCSRCHGSVTLDAKYNLPVDRVQTYVESYHGLAAQYGSTVVANCASCHGYHKVLPSSDPASTINTNNLIATCGQCHPGANQMFVSGRIHADLAATAEERDLSGKINGWVRRIYLALIFGVVGAMFIHNALLFLKKTAARFRATARPVLRMSAAQRWQHFVLAGSFIILAVTGFALKFPDSWLAKLLGSNEPFRRWTHRIAGIVLLLAGIFHLVYLLSSRDGRKLLKDLFPVKKDLADATCAVKYLCGLSSQKPKIGRFGYAEKMEYWAVVWGTIIMGVTGLMVWFKLDVTRFLPRWAVDVALTIHYYEALLACLAIVVWHFYHVIFDPDVYPLNTACLDGKVSEEWQQHEHPLEERKFSAKKADSNSGAIAPKKESAETESPEN
ncbi:MAG TPA: cytochrome b/b6 domain-containing protein [Verrucomicrobiae bacterium]|nr:cytochrome b/b6 domain-containing protein [Verrucomicrobiae bacterium]